jgi:hypothetical protein
MRLDRSGEVKSGNLNVTVRWRSPQHLWLYCSLMGVPPVAMTMPGHDPPVAWKTSPTYGDLTVVICPALRPGFLKAFLPAEIPVLEAEPGRR